MLDIEADGDEEHIEYELDENVEWWLMEEEELFEE